VPFLTEAKGKTLPLLILAPSGTTGPPIFSGPCPKNAAGILDLLKGVK